jgi:hypothetical protein
VVKAVERSGQTLYVCEECGLAYNEKEWAEKCEQWCREHGTCNIEIIEHGAPLEEN